jgi:hypothetical protein
MDPATLSVVAAEFMKQGIIGAVVVVLLVVVGVLWKKYTDVQEARLKDMNSFMEKFGVILEKTMVAQKDTNTILEIIRDRVSQNNAGRRE